MKKYFLINILLTLISLHAAAQYYYYDDKYYDNAVVIEGGLSGGLMNSFTDVGNSTSHFKNFNLSGGAYASFIFNDVLGLRLEYTMGQVKAEDSLDVLKGTRERNLSFRSSINEVDLLVEFYPLGLFNLPNGGAKLSPYLLGGLGYFSFNPQTYYEGYWINLQPLHTEGEGFAEYPNSKNYSLTQLNLPFGAGLKYEISPMFTLRGELVYRALFTDYLDDASNNYIDPSLFAKYLSPTNAAIAEVLYSRQNEISPGFVQKPGPGRGSTKHNDSYYSVNLKLGININRQKRY
jgi:hypothetical protein